MIRATVSALPPGANPIKILMGCDGKDSAAFTLKWSVKENTMQRVRILNFITVNVVGLR
jgi:hypothetical protein